MTRQPDRRIDRTRRACFDAIIALTLEKGYEKISVKDICAHANIGRTTFYTHFLDKDDLLQQCIQQFTAGLDLLLAQNDQQNTPLPILALVSHAREHRTLFLAFTNRGALLDVFQIELAKFVARQFSVPNPFKQVRTGFVVGGTITVIRWWLENNFPITTEAVVAELEKLVAVCHELALPER